MSSISYLVFFMMSPTLKHSIKINMRLNLRLLALSLCSTAILVVDANCDIQNSVAVDLTAAIASSNAVFRIYVEVPVDTTTLNNRTTETTTLNNRTTTASSGAASAGQPSEEVALGSTSVSMDCLEIVEGTDKGTLLGVFHCGAGGDDGHNALWIAQADAVDGHVPSTGEWTVTGKLSSQGSQGYVKVASDGAVFLAFEVSLADQSSS